MTPAELQALSQSGAKIAAALDDLRLPFAGTVRRMAQALALLAGGEPIAEPGPTCAGCGVPVDQPATGRPRRWCSERCRDRSRKDPGKGTVAA